MPGDPRKDKPQQLGVFDIQIRLGECLEELREYAEAEPLLLSGYKGLKEHEDKMSARDEAYLRRALQALVRLYQATGKPDQAAEWHRKEVEQ